MHGSLKLFSSSPWPSIIFQNISMKCERSMLNFCQLILQPEFYLIGVFYIIVVGIYTYLQITMNNCKFIEYPFLISDTGITAIGKRG